MDLNINKVLRSAIRSHQTIYRKFVYGFCKHYFYCDIHPTDKISPTAEFAHNGLGVIVNEDATIGDNVLIQHHVTIGTNGKGVPQIGGGQDWCPCYNFGQH